MNLQCDISLIQNYTNASQIARILTENWVEKNIFCPNCGTTIQSYENNRPVADFYCLTCKEQFELKSKKGSLGKKVTDGAYDSMITRLKSSENPNFFFLTYALKTFQIHNFVVMPKHFFTPEIIEKRKPLSPNAKRAGWVGCNILLHALPESGKIFYIQNQTIQSKDAILEKWAKTLFLKESYGEQKGWILDIITCIEKLNKKQFTRQELLTFIPYLQTKYPKNNNIEFKISQQLQVLRDKGFLKFTARGNYELLG
ncbi:MAG: restriction endonuclease [Epsilonproteobacteria bacterium]|nr:restriction endonuclease [Campylobacterota bacterium]